MYCTNCGRAIKPNTKFCWYCGNALANGDASQSLVQPVFQEAPSPVVEQQKKETPARVRPWVRFFARGMDYNLVSFSIGFAGGLGSIIGIISQESLDSFLQMPDILLFMLAIFLWIFVEPVFLSTWGTTPGKWLFKTTVRALDGNRLTFSQAFSRSASVWLKGYAIGIPLLSFITLLIAYDNITKNGSASWDKGNFVVLHEKIGIVRTVLIIFVYIVITLIIISGSIQDSTSLSPYATRL